MYGEFSSDVFGALLFSLIAFLVITICGYATIRLIGLFRRGHSRR
jgi:hypothetical protein